MTPQENEREFKKLLHSHINRRFNHHVEQFAAIVTLALFGACLYAATHVTQIEEAHLWLFNLSHSTRL